MSIHGRKQAGEAALLKSSSTFFTRVAAWMYRSARKNVQNPYVTAKATTVPVWREL
jgi:hypothetical protein